MFFRPNARSNAQPAGWLRRLGTATVEFAVVAPLLVVVTVGMVEVTRIAQVKNYLTDAARSSCRLAVDPSSTSDMVKTNINTILTANGIAPANATISITVNGAAVDVKTAKKYDQILVKIQVPISSVEWVTPMFFNNISVESETFVMMHH